MINVIDVTDVSPEDRTMLKSLIKHAQKNLATNGAYMHHYRAEYTDADRATAAKDTEAVLKFCADLEAKLA